MSVVAQSSEPRADLVMLAGVLLGTAVYVAVLVLARWSMRHMTTRHLTVREGQLTQTTMYRRA